jgi:hypothetical protein
MSFLHSTGGLVGASGDRELFGTIEKIVEELLNIARPTSG